MSLQHLPIIYCTMSLQRISSATIYIGAPSATIKNNYLNISKNSVKKFEYSQYMSRQPQKKFRSKLKMSIA